MENFSFCGPLFHIPTQGIRLFQLLAQKGWFFSLRKTEQKFLISLCDRKQCSIPSDRGDLNSLDLL